MSFWVPMSTVLMLMAPQAPSSMETARSPSLRAKASIMDMYVCHESPDVAVIDVHLEVRLQNTSGRPVYVPREMYLMRQSLAADERSALSAQWEVPSFIADVLAGAYVRALGRSDLIKIPAFGEWREQVTAGVRVKRTVTVDDPTAVPGGTHYLVLELGTLPTWAKAPTARPWVPDARLRVAPITVAPLRIDTAKALLIGECADSQIDWAPRPTR